MLKSHDSGCFSASDPSVGPVSRVVVNAYCPAIRAPFRIGEIMLMVNQNEIKRN